jgi:proline iminopeptidase
MSPDQQSRLDLLEGSPERTPAQEQEYRALSWFTDHADRTNAWAWALEDAAVPDPINFAGCSTPRPTPGPTMISPVWRAA